MIKEDYDICNKLAHTIYENSKKRNINPNIYFYNLYDYAMENLTIDNIQIYIYFEIHSENISQIYVTFEKNEYMYDDNNLEFSSNNFSILNEHISDNKRKRKLSAYNMYCREHKNDIQKENENTKLLSKDISKILSDRWKTVKKDKNILLEYQKKANENNLEYTETRNKNVIKLFNVLYNILKFRDKYCYSKVLDEIILKTVIKQKEEIQQCNNYICNINKYDCCVCLEPISIKCKTQCGHYVCRLCISKLRPKKCPMCRRCYCENCQECM